LKFLTFKRKILVAGITVSLHCVIHVCLSNHKRRYSKCQEQIPNPKLFFSNLKSSISRSGHFLYFVFLEISEIEEVDFGSRHHIITELCYIGACSYHKLGYSKCQEKIPNPKPFFSNGKSLSSRSGHFLHFVFPEIFDI